MKNFKYSSQTYNLDSANIVVPILIDQFSPKSVVDFGCGNATWLLSFFQNGIRDLFGVDYNSLENNEFLIDSINILVHDLNKKVELNRQFDLAICLETAEHLSEESSDILIENLVNHSKLILFSAAIPGQGGKGHINEQWPNYWFEKFAHYNYSCYDLIRPKIWSNDNVQCWYRQNIYLFSHANIPNEEITTSSKNEIHPCLLESKNLQIESILSGKMGLRTGIKVFLNSILHKVKSL